MKAPKKLVDSNAFNTLLRIAAGDSPEVIPALLIEHKLVRTCVTPLVAAEHKVFADWQITAKGRQFIETYKALDK